VIASVLGTLFNWGSILLGFGTIICMTLWSD